ncbi:hypothetical protein HOO65_070501 [Ceratocystis lukuohia]|uniref:Uncharacterized protein n=2 Tax=Ceratocystis TaxID=5157 RepID=A0A2C5X2Q3_9PEZI|nr:hypothetical protein CFIMG_003969RA [Ceratocystis fimbriata CBS 114723]
MSSFVARRFLSTTARRMTASSKVELKKDSKKNPEVIILGAVVACALGGAGLYFGNDTPLPFLTPFRVDHIQLPATIPRHGSPAVVLLLWVPGSNPTHANSEASVAVASQAWENNGSGKYQYYPGGDISKAPKDAPSALNVVVVPKMTLPADVHERYNKWGKEGYP